MMSGRDLVGRTLRHLAGEQGIVRHPVTINIYSSVYCRHHRTGVSLIPSGHIISRPVIRGSTYDGQAGRIIDPVLEGQCLERLQPLVVVILIQLLNGSILRRKTAARGRVHDQDDLALAALERQLFAAGRFHRIIINAAHNNHPFCKNIRFVKTLSYTIFNTMRGDCQGRKDLTIPLKNSIII